MHRLTEFSLRRPWLTLAVLLAITVGLGAGMSQLEKKYGYRVLIGEDHPAVQNMDALIAQYGGGAPVFVAWECGPGHPCQSVFDEASLRMAEELTQQFREQEHIVEVLSPANAPILVPSEGGFEIRHLVEQGEITSDAGELSRLVQNNPLWVGELISEDGKAGVLIIQPNDTSDATNVDMHREIGTALAPYEEQGFTFHPIGDAHAAISVSQDLDASMARVIPLTALVIALILFALSRSATDAGLSFLVIVFALVWTFGLMGWLGWPRDTIVQILAPLILIIGVCDAIHLLRRKRDLVEASGGALTADPMILAAKSVGNACLITSLTTAAAFASFATSGLASFVRFGLEAAFASLACLVLSFSLLPIAEKAIRARTSNEQQSTQRSWKVVLDSILGVTQQRSLTIIVVSLLIVIFGSYQWLSNLRVDTDWLTSLGEESRVTTAVNFFETKLGGNSTLELEIALPEGQDLSQPDALETIAKLQERLALVNGLGRTRSIVDPITHLNRVMNNDDPSFEILAKTPDENMQLLELLNFSAPVATSQWVSPDLTHVRVSSEAPLRKQSDWINSLEAARKIHKAVLPPDWKVTETGALAARVDWVDEIQNTQIRSFPTAFAIVFVLVSVFLRSWKLGLAAMIPTLVPVIFILGLMGISGMSLDVARAMIAAVVIGIGVDDAVHILAQYKARRDEGLDAHAAMQAALHHTGRAVVTTSVALALGFLTLMMSAWQTIASFGFLVSIAILGALAASLFVLPALIFTFARQD